MHIQDAKDMADKLYQLSAELNGHVRQCALAGLCVTGEMRDTASYIGGETPYPLAAYKVTISPHNIDL